MQTLAKVTRNNDTLVRKSWLKTAMNNNVNHIQD